MVGLVFVLAVISGLVGRLTARPLDGVVAAVALAGALLPAWAYLAFRPALGDLLGGAVGVGPGLWLHVAGHLLVAGAVLTNKKDDGDHRLFAVSERAT
jgi:hypothetical protein